MESEFFKVCLVAIVKDENKFLDEWLVYHKLLGIDHFFIYDDDEFGTVTEWCTPHQQYVDVIKWRDIAHLKYSTEQTTNQVNAYNHALKYFIKDYEWVIFLDADEFVVLREHETVKGFLLDFPLSSSIALNWHVFGHNGFMNDPSGLITATLTKRMASADINIKTFTKTEAIAAISDVHSCRLRKGQLVDVNGRLYTNYMYPNKTAVANINHYQSRSYTRWMKRVERGNANYTIDTVPQDKKWKLNKDMCFRQFITTVAVNKNEIHDRFLLNYESRIKTGIESLNRSALINYKNSYQSDEQFRIAISSKLRLMAYQCANSLFSRTDFGLFEGNVGTLLFLFHYCKFNNDSELQNVADECFYHLWDHVSNADASYGHGLAGFGAVSEYLIQNGYIEVKSDFLLELDEYLLLTLLNQRSGLNIEFEFGVTGVGKYFLFRLKDPDLQTTEQTKKIISAIELIVSMLEKEFDDYESITSAVSFLGEAYAYISQKEKARYLAYVLALKLERMFLEDVFFQVLPRSFDPIGTARILLKVSNNLDDGYHASLSKKILEVCENAHFNKQTRSDPFIAKGMLRTYYENTFLFDMSGHFRYLTRADESFAIVLDHFLSDEVTSEDLGAPAGVLNGYPGVALSVMNYFDETDRQWLNLIFKLLIVSICCTIIK